MTERERWVVYPLLFLALGAALRDKLVDRTTTKSIVCQELTIVEDEPDGHQPVRVLAKIGRGESKTNAPSTGVFWINGSLEVIDDDPTGVHAPRPLVKIGRTDPAPGALASGYAVVSGQLVVDGLISARQCAFQSLSFLPTFQVLPGIPVPDVLRALPAPQGQQLPNTPKDKAPGKQSKASPPATTPDSSPNDAPAKSQSDKNATPNK